LPYASKIKLEFRGQLKVKIHFYLLSLSNIFVNFESIFETALAYASGEPQVTVDENTTG
jgi:hypothetical protein